MDSNIMQKIEGTLITLFMTFDQHQLTIINKNIKTSQRKLNESVQQLLLFMQQKDIGYEPFLSSKCQPIIDFYLAPLRIQQQLFLSQDKLHAFFNAIPLVEAHVLNNKINSAQQVAQLNKQYIQAERAHIVEFSHYQKTLTESEVEKITQLKQILSTTHAEGYIDYFYQLNQGELSLVAEQQKYQTHMLLYSELSPLQQLTAQRLFKDWKSKPAFTA